MPNSIFDARPLRDEKAAYAYVEEKIGPNGRVGGSIAALWIALGF